MKANSRRTSGFCKHSST